MFLLAYYDNTGKRSNITNEDVSKALKVAQLFWTTLQPKAFQLIASILICYGAEAPMPSLWRGTRTPTSRRGAVVWGHIQGVHPQRASMLLRRDANKHEEGI